MILPFVPWPDRRLRTAAAPVGDVTDEIRTLAADMIETMEAMPGVGLAAPQIGVLLRVAVVDASAERGQAIALVDPELVSASDELFVWEEGSPNLQGVSAELKRPREVVVAYTDLDGVRRDRTFRDLWSTSVQHQLDHLAGRMYFDRLSKVKRAMLIRRAGKRGKRAG